MQILIRVQSNTLVGILIGGTHGQMDTVSRVFSPIKGFISFFFPGPRCGSSRYEPYYSSCCLYEHCLNVKMIDNIPC